MATSYTRLKARDRCGSKALATPPATFMNQWPWLAEQSCRLPHKRHYEGRRDDVSKNIGYRNYQGIPTGNPWNPVVATPWPTETVLSRSLSLSSSPTLSRRISLPNRRQWWGTSCRSCGGLARLGWSGYSEPTCFLSLHGEIACRPSGKGLRSLIAWMGQQHPSSLHTRRWRHEDWKVYMGSHMEKIYINNVL